MPVVEVVVAAAHVALLVLLSLLLWIQVADAAVDALLEAEVLRACVHQRLRRLCYRYGPMLGLAGGGRPLNLPRMLSRAEILLHLALSHVLNMLVHVLAHRLRTVLFVQVL